MSAEFAHDREARETRTRLYARFGVPCPYCLTQIKESPPALLLPGGWCKAHRFQDRRAPLTAEEVIEMELAS